MLINDLYFILPELIIASCICLLILINSLAKSLRQYSGVLIGSAAMIACIFSSLMLFGENPIDIFNSHFKIDRLATGLKLVTFVTALIVMLGTNTDKLNAESEIILIELFAVLGVLILCSANNLLTLYLGLETLTLSMYGLVASKKSSEIATESAMKFFIQGAIASAIFLYGTSLIYGLYQTLSLTIFSNPDINNSIELQLALTFIICGIAFKFGAFPFHSWVPDSYHGSSNSVALFISPVPKIGAFALIYRLLITSFIAVTDFWTILILILGLLSLILGNLIAISQSNLKRMLGYSAIGHMGFILIAISIGSLEGVQASLFYLLVYILMTSVAFMCLEVLSNRNRSIVTLSDIKDLNSSHPWIALIMLFSMFSMVGIPPLIGFYAKWIVLSELINAEMLSVSIIAIIMSVIAAFYYLRVVWYMYFEKTELPVMKKGSTLIQKSTLSVIGAMILLIGLYPSPIIDFCKLIISPFILID